MGLGLVQGASGGAGGAGGAGAGSFAGGGVCMTATPYSIVLLHSYLTPITVCAESHCINMHILHVLTR